MTCKAIILTCMDYRFVKLTHENLKTLGYEKNYDVFAAAGASLMYNDDKDKSINELESFKKVFEIHVDLAKKLHDVKEILIIDHEDCGAYKEYYGDALNKLNEFAIHIMNTQLSLKELQAKYPKIKVKIFYLRKSGELQMLSM